jgi:hypothetical protein
MTLDEIVERLVLPPTAIYEWLKDLPLGKPRRRRGSTTSRSTTGAYTRGDGA